MALNIAYWIAFGPHGPRAMSPPGEGWRVFTGVVIAVVVSYITFCLIRTQAKPPPRTMNKEWQEATNEYLKVSFIHPGSSFSQAVYGDMC